MTNTSNPTFRLQAITHDDRTITIASSTNCRYLMDLMKNQAAHNTAARYKYYRKLEVVLSLGSVDFPERRDGGVGHGS